MERYQCSKYYPLKCDDDIFSFLHFRIGKKRRMYDTDNGRRGQPTGSEEITKDTNPMM